MEIPLASRRAPAPDRRLIPALGSLVLGALLWGTLMAACAMVSLYLRNRLLTPHVGGIALLFFSGGLAAWPFVVLAARLVSRSRATEKRFAAAFVAISVGTIAMTAFLFAMEYRTFFSQWHQPFPSRIWFFQFVFTAANAVYQFAVMGLSLYLPAGLPVLAAASLWLARAMR
ncbi:hypothetical protein LXM94_03560 [Rhizobium sp. TRM95111]|uniref:hypothetical protein n=1 Tax=Rhizobium alarense TaxID=2846851 RepID=UPI001F29C036|nr:hypothetical protein [Rhizobium alarense]MCF3639041.1 hypothetical protein [Rhizobium alarense]